MRGREGARGWGGGIPAALQKQTDDRNRPVRLFPYLGLFSFILFDPDSPAPLGPEGKQARGRAKSPAAGAVSHCPFWRIKAGPEAVTGAIPAPAVCAPSPGRAVSATQLRGRRESGARSQSRGAHRAERGPL